MKFPKATETGIETGIETLAKVKGYEQLTKRQKEVLALMLSNNQITYSEMKEALGINTDRGLSKHIEKLKEAGSIHRDQDFGGRWILHFK